MSGSAADPAIGSGPRERSAVGPWLPLLEIPAGIRRVVVACSGGTDSLALLALSCAAGLDVVAVHVDHGLRPGAEQEFEAVRAAAETRGAAAVGVRVEVPPGSGLEERARAARLDVLEGQRTALDADAVAFGHTRDDQAETVLLNVLRGAAGSGLAGIPPARGAVLHPILRLGRADTTEICARLRLAPLLDPMNDDPTFRRVWLRREVIPLLEAGTGRDLREVLARQAAVLRDESDLLDDMASQHLAAAGVADALDSLATAVLVDAELATARRIVRVWLGPPPPSSADVEAVLTVARGESSGVDISGHGRIERSRGRLHRLDAPVAELVPFEIPTPGRADGAGWSFDSWVERGAPTRWPDGRLTCVLDADMVGGVAVVRPPGSGERFRPLGMAGSKTVTSVLADHGVPRGVRASQPIVATVDGTPLWVVGYRVGGHARVTASTRRYLWLRAERRAMT